MYGGLASLASCVRLGEKSGFADRDRAGGYRVLVFALLRSSKSDLPSGRLTRPLLTRSWGNRSAAIALGKPRAISRAAPVRFLLTLSYRTATVDTLGVPREEGPSYGWGWFECG